jgi:hypothetical protein
MAGIHRSSTLDSLGAVEPGLLGMAGIHRSSTLEPITAIDMLRLGMAGIHRSSTLGRVELAEKQRVDAVSLFKKARFDLEFLRVRAAFFHRTPPSCQTGDRLRSSSGPAQAAG